MGRLSLLAAVGLVALGTAGWGVSRAADAGPSVSRSYPVGSFTRIDVAGPYEVEVTTGGQPSVQARGGENILEQTVVEVKGGTLAIHPRKGSGSSWNWSGRSDKVRFTVSVPSLAAAMAAGSGNVSVNRVAGERFQGEIAGSGGMKLADVQVGELGLEIAGSGNIEARGRAGQARYEIAGSGNILAGQLASDRLDAEIAGSGNIEAHARTSAKVDIAGAGNVDVRGGAKCTVSKAGSGNVNCS